jgi:hypothetical protein
MTSHLLSPDDLIVEATRNTNFQRYLDDGLRGRFTHIVESFNANKPISSDDLPKAVAQISQNLRNRLLLERDWAEHPEILEQPIDHPLFVVGSPRTGTTILQCLLAQDTRNRVAYYWQTASPSPPPGLDPQSVAPRIAQEDRNVEEMVRVIPRFLSAHPYLDQGGLAEVEDEDIFSADFHCAFPQRYYKVASLTVWVPPSDPTLRFKFHKKFLQHLQWRLPAKRWVCKGTSHQFDLPSLWEVYPDATCVWPHRDPVAFIGSLLELVALIYEPISGLKDEEFSRTLVQYVKQGYDAVLAADWLDDERLVHVRFNDLNIDQIGTIQKIYERLGTSMSAEFKDAIQQWVRDPANRSERHGKFQYSVERFGFTCSEIRDQFGSYYSRFGLE